MKAEIRYPSHPDDFKQYDTARIRKEFHVGNLFIPGEAKMIYSHFDRMIIVGIQPAKDAVELLPDPYQMATHFLQRRELAIINIGGSGKVKVDGQEFVLENQDALYLGMGNREVFFSTLDEAAPAKFYLNSALAHAVYPDVLVKKEQANPVYLGDTKHSNKRVLKQYIVPGIVQTCQVMMGITTVEEGSSWNTMPCHRHELRMEVYLYFDIEPGQSVCHLMGEPDETRPVWLSNEEAVISPSWSIHTASGTSPYSFIWGMSGSDSEMDPVEISQLK